MAVSGNPNRADEVQAGGGRRALAESTGGSDPRACMRANCATVLVIRHGGLDESPPPAQVQGPLKRQPPFGPYDPHVPPINQPSFLVQKHTDIWVIEVRRRDGTIQSIEQHYPALFQVGDQVLVEGDRVRAAD
ncbi:MAG TPA: hypothetical protein VMH26_10930 [Burkholderiales bacterium]|nr:hypothetical protein [Burkholderiales bacterium]